MSGTFGEQLDAITWARCACPLMHTSACRARIDKAMRALRAAVIAALGWQPEGPWSTGDVYVASMRELARWADSATKASGERGLNP